MRKIASLFAVLCVLGLATETIAQAPQLRLNGQVDAAIPLGGALDIQVTTTPNVPLFVMFNVDPGPTFIPTLGVTLPIAINQNLVGSHVNVLVPANGVFARSMAIFNNPFLEGVKFYGFAITFDATQPFGLGFSNGVSATLVRGADAGPNTAGVTNRGITLDGSDTTSSGPLPMGFDLAWSIASGPVGHNASLAGANTAFPTLLADVAGTYQLELSVLAPGTTGGATDTAQVDVFDFDVTSHAQGDFDPSDPLAFSVDLNGPAPSAFDAVGIATAAGNTLAASIPAQTPQTSVVFEFSSLSGQTVGDNLTVVNNAGASLATLPAASLLVHIGQPLADDVEGLLETAFSAIDLSGPIMGIPTIPVITIPGPFGTTLFSANVTPTGFSYDPMIDIELTFNAGAIHGQLIINNVNLTFDIAGLIIVPYTDMGVLAITQTVVDFDIVPVASGGTYMTTVMNETATLNGASLTFVNGVIPSNLATTLLGSLVPTIETTVATLIAGAVPPAFDAALNALPQTIDLTASGIPATLSLVPSMVDLVAGGMTLVFDAGATATAIDPAAVALSAYYATPNAPPSYNGMIPGSGVPYAAAAGVGDDFLNQTIAAALQAGALEQTFSGALDIMGIPATADAATFAFLFPGVGFEKLDPAAPVSLHIHPTVAPIVTVGASTGELLELHVADFEVTASAEVAPGYSAPIIRFGLSGTAGIDVSVDLMMMTLSIVPGTISAQAHVLDTLPGVNAAPVISSLGGLLPTLLPGILTGSGLTSIPLPDLGLTATTLVGVAADGPAGDYVSLFLN